MGLLKSLTRISSQVWKEFIQVVRRPGAFFSLILGPFLIMAMFGAGYSGVRRPLETVIVIPEGVQLSRNVEDYARLSGPAITIEGVVSDPSDARERLVRQELDLVVVAPQDLEERFRAGQRTVIGVEFNQIDPVLSGYTAFIAYRLTQEVNREILQRAVEQGEGYAMRALGQEDITSIPPEVIAAPTEAQTVNVAPTPPNVVTYFAPAVFALILQHMAVTLTALSLVRERLGGVMELFRVSPVNSLELVIGKYLGFGVINALVAAIVAALLIFAFRVPLLGDPVLFVAIVAALVFASLGLGLLISVVADSERQAVQLSLLVLLASVFFSGFVLPVAEFRPEVQAFSYALPVTNGIRLLQDVMLRGTTYVLWQLGVLVAVGIALLVLTTLLLRRSMSRG